MNRWIAGSALGAALVGAGSAWGQASLTWLPPYPGSAGGQGGGSPLGMSADGSVVIGRFVNATTGNQLRAFRWSSGGGMQALPSTFSGARWEAYAVSPDGQTTVGYGYGGPGNTEWQACTWNPAGAQTPLGTLPDGHYSDARSISATGAITGTSSTPAGQRAYVWTAANGMTALPPVDGFYSSAALVISADGTTVGGGCGTLSGSLYHATIWVNGAPQDLGVLPGDIYADVRSLSPDGSVAVGESGPLNSASSAGRKAYRWTAATGMRALFDIPVGYTVTQASADGAVVACGMIWTEARGLRQAADVFADYGITMSGAAFVVSADGHRLAGSGANAGQPTAWIATLPPGFACYANCDGSTSAPVLNIADFTCFLQKFAASDPAANCDGSSAPPTLNIADFTCFLQRFAAGCP